METMTTTQIIEKALNILKYQDWTWYMADYTHPAEDDARSSMRAFVRLVATIADKAIVKAMRDLWTATYEYNRATKWGSNEKAEVAYNSKKAELMAVIQPQCMVAA